MPRRKKQKGEPANESFEMTYIALMLLLLCFMVIMVSLAQLEGPRFRRAIGSVKGALAMLTAVSGRNVVPGEGEGILTEKGGGGMIAVEVPDYEELLERLLVSLRATVGEDLEDMVQVEVTETGFSLTLGSLVLFGRGQAALKPEARPVLDEVAALLSDWGGRIEVTGHTCDLPIHTAMYPSNWDLSVARAVEVVRYLNEAGVDGRRLMAVGRGETFPLYPNETESLRALNRRVEIVWENEECFALPQATGDCVPQEEEETASNAEDASPWGHDQPWEAGT